MYIYFLQGDVELLWPFECPGLQCASLLALVGYHNEHHDFPLIPWIRLPALRALAPEFYDTLPGHPSWPMLTYRFIFDEDVGLYSRVKRQPKEAGLKKVDTKVTKEAEAEGERWYASDDECVKEKKH
ncbi:hypothetical protein FRC08_018114 [Ceratobasidium sp. 394]|nr:hypothetical protein FRC08_018114 [Ceratobasidium sp. 394]